MTAKLHVVTLMQEIMMSQTSLLDITLDNVCSVFIVLKCTLNSDTKNRLIKLMFHTQRSFKKFRVQLLYQNVITCS